jgi:hypothetical protein
MIGRDIGTEICSPADSGRRSGDRHARTPTRIITASGLLLAQRQRYFGPGAAPKKIADGAELESTPRRTALVSHLVRISFTYTEVLGNVRMWGMGKSEKLSVVVLHGVIAKPAGGRGHHASDGGANAVLGLAILVDSILPRCPCMCVEEDHMRSSIRCQVRFLPNLMGRERGGESLVGRDGGRGTTIP